MSLAERRTWTIPPDAERRTWTIPPDDLPKDAVIDFGRRQNWEVQHAVTIELMYNN